LKFEKAEMMRRKLEYLEQYQARSVIVSKHLGNLDVFSIYKEGDSAYVNYLMVQHGTIVQTHTIQLESHLDESSEEVLLYAIGQLRSAFNSMAAEIIVPFELPGWQEESIEERELIITVPKAGDKKKLLELSRKNVNY